MRKCGMLEEVAWLEINNDGQTVHLYYDSLTGCYLAYGLSAYCASVVASFVSFSDELQMPVVVLDRNAVGLLMQKMEPLEYTPQKYYRLRMNRQVDLPSYHAWADAIHNAQFSMHNSQFTMTMHKHNV